MATDIFKLLETDHRDIASLMETMANGSADGRNTFEKIKGELIAHSKAEEKEFYSVLRGNEETSEQVGEAIEEHAEVEDLLDELSGMDIDDEEWSAKFGELRHNVERHVHEEEGEIFPKARHVIGERAEEIGRRFRQAKQQVLQNGGDSETSGSEHHAEHRARPQGQDEIESLTRDELYDRAREMGIDGRSKMTKNELARAVRGRG